jgi:hypothetical protein
VFFIDKRFPSFFENMDRDKTAEAPAESVELAKAS